MTKQITIFITISATIISLFGWQPAYATPPPVLITEVQTGFIDDSAHEFPLQEFIEITNTSQAAVNLTGWKLEYLSSANDGTAAPTLTIDTLGGQISPGGHGIWEHEGYYPIAPDSIFGAGDKSTSGFLAKSGGHVRLMNGASMVDCVSWGSAVAIVGCDKVTATPNAGYTVQRPLVNGLFDKAAGVANLKPATPQGNNIYAVPTDSPLVIPLPAITIPGSVCETIQLSEILANPAGDDTQGEYIELYNPASYPQTLSGCSLQLATGKQYAFKASDVLEPHQYKSYPYSVTALQLGNSGGTVTLLTSADQVSTTYPAVGDDQAWVASGGGWQVSHTPTPDASNSIDLPVASVATVNLVADLTAELEPCPAGKYRNPETNRCRNVGALETAPAACVAGQERNLATGRCRKIVTASTPTPCLANQERNPETGRCRKVETANVTQKPCDPGQERNAETNRCRKVTASSGGKVLGASTTKPKTYHYVLVGVVLTGLLGYGIYEYRHSIGNLYSRLKRGRATL